MAEVTAPYVPHSRSLGGNYYLRDDSGSDVLRLKRRLQSHNAPNAESDLQPDFCGQSKLKL
jgi:hypothetical protein